MDLVAHVDVLPIGKADRIVTRLFLFDIFVDGCEPVSLAAPASSLLLLQHDVRPVRPVIVPGALLGMVVHPTLYVVGVLRLVDRYIYVHWLLFGICFIFVVVDRSGLLLEVTIAEILVTDDLFVTADPDPAGLIDSLVVVEPVVGVVILLPLRDVSPAGRNAPV